METAEQKQRIINSNIKTLSISEASPKEMKPLVMAVVANTEALLLLVDTIAPIVERIIELQDIDAVPAAADDIGGLDDGHF